MSTDFDLERERQLEAENSLGERNKRKVEYMVKYPNMPYAFIDALAERKPLEDIIPLMAEEKEKFIEAKTEKNREKFIGRLAIQWKVEEETQIREKFSKRETELKLNIEEAKKKCLLQKADLQKLKYKKSLKETELAHTLFLFFKKKKQLKEAIVQYEKKIEKQNAVVQNCELTITNAQEQLGKHMGAMNAEIQSLEPEYAARQEEELRNYILAHYELDIAKFELAVEEVKRLIAEREAEKQRILDEERKAKEAEEQKLKEAIERSRKNAGKAYEKRDGSDEEKKEEKSSEGSSLSGLSIKATAEKKKVRVNRFAAASEAAASATENKE